MNASPRIELTELNFADGADRKLSVNASLVYALVPLFPVAVGTVVKMIGGRLHVQESPHEIKELLRHARQHGSANLADLPPDPDEELFATSVLPSPVWVRNTIYSRPEDLTLNGVDLRYLIEQYARIQGEIRAEALGE
jgi:hypothetical protein